MPRRATPSSETIPAGLLRTIVERELVPLLPGAELQPGVKGATSGRGTVVKLAPNALGLRSSTTVPDLLEVTRVQPFSKSEVDLARQFLAELAGISPHHAAFFFPEATAAAVRRTVVRSLGYPNEALLLRVLGELESLAAQTYEGHRIAVVFGLDSKARGKGVTLDTIWGEDFGKVLTGSIETMIAVSSDGFISEFLDLYPNASCSFAPQYSRTLSEWCTGERVVVSLNRNGEILLYREKCLVFAWRRGRWRHFVHEPILGQMHNVSNKELRRCIYETCLDVSFGRSGGCIGVMMEKHASLLPSLVKDPDRLPRGDSAKARVLTELLSDKQRQFRNLPRRLRQAMAAIDGALVLDHRGRVLAVGAIVTVDSGSDAGARKAAAKAVAKLGFGVKISADGEVTGFCGDGKPESVKQVFKFG